MTGAVVESQMHVCHLTIMPL